jgi:hypothetical protein
VFGMLQAIVSVVVLLLEYGMIKLAPRSAVPHNAGGYQQQGQGQGGYGQQPPPDQQGTTYMNAPGAQQQQAPQSTQFLQHPGQLSHQQNPPGGYGNE